MNRDVRSLTIFASPRPFTGVFDRIQTNALRSWRLLEPSPDVIVFGGDRRAGEVCGELGLRWVREIACARSGAPMLDSLFTEAQRLATRPFLAYVNPDVILLQECMDAIAAVRSVRPDAVIVAAPWNTDVPGLVREDGSAYADGLREARAMGRAPARGSGADLFGFRPGVFDPVPPLTVGRLGWDNWLLWRAATHRGGAVDITDVAGLIHQDHPGTTHRGSTTEAAAIFADEVRANELQLSWWTRLARRSEVESRLRGDGEIERRFRFGRARIGVTLALRAARIAMKPLLERAGLWEPLKDASDRRHERRTGRR